MAMLDKILVFYLMISLAIAFGAPGQVFTSGSPSENSILSFFNVNYNSTSNEIIFNPSLSNESTSAINSAASPAERQGSTFLYFMDPILQVLNFFGIILKILVSPLILLSGGMLATAPPALMAIIGIPSCLLLYLGLIYFIRSGQ